MVSAEMTMHIHENYKARTVYISLHLGFVSRLMRIFLFNSVDYQVSFFHTLLRSTNRMAAIRISLFDSGTVCWARRHRAGSPFRIAVPTRKLGNASPRPIRLRTLFPLTVSRL